MREIVHMQAGQCGNQIGAKVSFLIIYILFMGEYEFEDVIRCVKYDISDWCLFFFSFMMCGLTLTELNLKKQAMMTKNLNK